MKKAIDISELIGFSLGQSIKDKTLLKWLGVLFVIELITAITMFSVMGGFFETFTQMTKANPQVILNSILGIYLAFIPIAIVSILISLAITYFVIARGLKISKLNSVPFTLGRYIRFVILNIAVVIWAGLSLFNLKMLAIGIVGVILFVCGLILMIFNAIAGVVLLAFGILVLIAYGVVFIYNMLRLYVGEVSFIEKEKGIIASLKESWDLTQGNVLIILIASIVLAVIFMIIGMAATIPSMIYSFSAIFSQIGQGTVSPTVGLDYLADPLYHIALLPTYVVSAYTAIVSNIFIVKLFTMLKTK